MYTFVVVNKSMITNKHFMNTINKQELPFVIISVLSPEYGLDGIQIEKGDYCQSHLIVYFHDVNDDGSVNSLKEVGDIIIPMNETHAKRIIEFVMKWKDKVNNFIIHCEAGMSRSPGVALALSEILNGQENAESFVQTLYDIKFHNPKVKQMILDTYKRKKNKLNISG